MQCCFFKHCILLFSSFSCVAIGILKVLQAVGLKEDFELFFCGSCKRPFRNKGLKKRLLAVKSIPFKFSINTSSFLCFTGYEGFPSGRQVNFYVHNWDNTAEWELHSVVTDIGIFPITLENGEFLRELAYYLQTMFLFFTVKNSISHFYKGCLGKVQH